MSRIRSQLIRCKHPSRAGNVHLSLSKCDLSVKCTSFKEYTALYLSKAVRTYYANLWYMRDELHHMAVHTIIRLVLISTRTRRRDFVSFLDLQVCQICFKAIYKPGHSKVHIL